MTLSASQKSLRAWTRQKWRTKSGKPSTQAMSSAQYAASSKKKREDTAKGKQFSKQPKAARRIAKRYR